MVIAGNELAFLRVNGQKPLVIPLYHVVKVTLQAYLVRSFSDFQ